MFIEFFNTLREAGVPASLREYLTLMETFERDVVERDIDGFYYLARAVLVKDEALFDRFDQVFGHVFKDLEEVEFGPEAQSLPEDWLRLLAERHFTPEEMREIEALGGFDALMETLRERLAEQQGRHQGGSKWIGTGGTSPFGHGGYNPEGVRIGGPGRHGRAVKVWEQRAYKDLRSDRELDTRSLKVALRRLRRFARTGAPDELDLPHTVRSTADRGWLDVKMRPERRNTVKLLLLFDVGGSMDWHVKACEELFSAARSEFRTMEHVYFHNCLYESVWTDNARRQTARIPTSDLLHRHSPDTRVIIVGDASMSPYEVTMPGGSVEHWNEEAGATWLRRLADTFDRLAWINPVPREHWGYTHSIGIVSDLVRHRMYPLTLDGLDDAMRMLSR